MERSLLPLLGLFPWECRLCQRKLYRWNRSGDREASGAQTELEARSRNLPQK